MPGGVLPEGTLCNALYRLPLCNIFWSSTYDKLLSYTGYRSYLISPELNLENSTGNEPASFAPHAKTLDPVVLSTPASVSPTLTDVVLVISTGFDISFPDENTFKSIVV